MQHTILVDFGSTYTKMCVFDLENGELVLTSRYPSTVKIDATIGLLANIEKAKEKIGEKGVKSANIVASSSAAGGLRMVVVGLTPRYSLLAGINVALGAGARVIKTYSFLLSEEDIKEIEEINPEILLLCGGVEGGNVEWTMHNAMLLSSRLKPYIPVIYAGNRSIAKDVRALFIQKGKECYVVNNVFPKLNQLNAAPASEVIRNIFMKRITGMKGLNKVKTIIDDIIMPTPAAVLAGGALISKGLPGMNGFGDSLIFDVGGATTDVYSFGKYKENNIKTVGSPEPDNKRTVEGDLGLRSSAISLTKSLDLEKLTSVLNINDDYARKRCLYRTLHEDYVPENDFEKKLDFELAKKAVFISARRHCGHIVNAYAKGAREIQEGKNLLGIRTLIGTGGPIINSINPKEVMCNALKNSREKDVLLPEKCDFYLDKEYLLYAVGLASTIDSKGALNIAIQNIIKI
jgi:uncharacterized protein (TIGR01319 family)